MILLFDIGGTKMRFATSNDGENLDNIHIIDTPVRFEDGIEEYRKYFELINKPEITLVSGGIAGPLNKERSIVINAPNLTDWNHKPYKSELESIFDAPVIIENDAALVGLGEATKGAGKNHKLVMFLTISTGVGGVRIVNGKIDVSSMGFEPGHQYIPLKHTNELCHLEGLISGSALRNKYDKSPEEITDDSIWEECAYYLSLGIHNSILFWSPDVVVLGGSMMNKISIEKVEENLKNVMKIFPDIPELKKAELAEKAGLYGALTLTKTPIA